jgi:glycyl-tRNA synthetase
VGNADRSAFDLTKHTERTKEKLVVREALKEPKFIQKTILEINKKLFGPAFKRDAKEVETYLLNLEEAGLKKLAEQLKSG